MSTKPFPLPGSFAFPDVMEEWADDKSVKTARVGVLLRSPEGGFSALVSSRPCRYGLFDIRRCCCSAGSIVDVDLASGRGGRGLSRRYEGVLYAISGGGV